MATRTVQVRGPAGLIEVLVDEPAPLETIRGLCLIAHPHPLFSGTNENKIVQTLARAFVQLGYAAWRPNFRGVGASEGTFDNGIGETQDLLAVLAEAKAQLGARGLNTAEPILAGFSFGSFVQTRVAQELEAAGQSYERLVLIGPATSRFDVRPVRSDTLVIHGEADETVPLASVMDWARPQSLPITVVPNADHFFNRKLVPLKQLILGAWGVRYIAA